MPHYRSIQALRFVAALLVMAFHLADGNFIVGAVGIDIFFVISGFIMGTIGVGETPSTFLAKRIIRVVPLYWAVTLFLSAVSVLGVFSRITVDPPSLAKSLLFIPYFEAGGDLWPIVPVGWTLNVEMLFYALFAAGLFLGTPIRFAAASLALLALAGAVFQPSDAILRQWTTPLLLEFAAGLALATRVRPSGIGKGLAMLGIGVIWLGELASLGIYDQYYRLLTWGVPAFLIVCGALAIERAGRWPSGLRALEIGGDASYSLYLLHGIVISAAAKILGTTLTAKVATAMIAILMALVSYRLFERPVGAVLTRFVRSRRRAVGNGSAAVTTER
ncbi:acyltransferase [Methylobacterium sp. 10]|uniref:acyltransferase family protein n=1 Tax=Methylobacterium sp. 10 TaxID=1101191 RepID=UPI0004B0154E|nr:acyltransferase [Methylobacterium sp. 10]